MGDRCLAHYVKHDEHCEEMERMLEEVPGDFCDGEGDQPHDAVRRLASAYEEAIAERDAYRSSLADMVAFRPPDPEGTMFDRATKKAMHVLKNGTAEGWLMPGEPKSLQE